MTSKSVLKRKADDTNDQSDDTNDQSDDTYDQSGPLKQAPGRNQRPLVFIPNDITQGLLRFLILVTGGGIPQNRHGEMMQTFLGAMTPQAVVNLSQASQVARNGLLPFITHAANQGAPQNAVDVGADPLDVHPQLSNYYNLNNLNQPGCCTLADPTRFYNLSHDRLYSMFHRCPPDIAQTLGGNPRTRKYCTHQNTNRDELGFNTIDGYRTVGMIPAGVGPDAAGQYADPQHRDKNAAYCWRCTYEGRLRFISRMAREGGRPLCYICRQEALMRFPNGINTCECYTLVDNMCFDHIESFTDRRVREARARALDPQERIIRDPNSAAVIRTLRPRPRKNYKSPIPEMDDDPLLDYRRDYDHIPDVEAERRYRRHFNRKRNTLYCPCSRPLIPNNAAARAGFAPLFSDWCFAHDNRFPFQHKRPVLNIEATYRDAHDRLGAPWAGMCPFCNGIFVHINPPHRHFGGFLNPYTGEESRHYDINKHHYPPNLAPTFNGQPVPRTFPGILGM